MGDLPERKYRISGSGGAFPRAPKTLGLLAGRIAPWAAFGLLLLWSWRFIDLAHALPTYDDVLEVVWITSWYDAAFVGFMACSFSRTSSTLPNGMWRPMPAAPRAC